MIKGADGSAPLLKDWKRSGLGSTDRIFRNSSHAWITPPDGWTFSCGWALSCAAPTAEDR